MNKFSSAMQPKPFYTTTELAAICDVNPVTIFRAITNGLLRAATTPGGHFRIPKDAAEEFLRKNNVPFISSQRDTRRVLIVEDNPTELRMFKRALERPGNFEVTVTSSGYSAGFLTRSFQPDLILLDIYLADIDGREVARLVNAEPELRHTKIVAITGANNPKELQDIEAGGFDAVISKPIKPAELVGRLRQILKF